MGKPNQNSYDKIQKHRILILKKHISRVQLITKYGIRNLLLKIQILHEMYHKKALTSVISEYKTIIFNLSRFSEMIKIQLIIHEASREMPWIQPMIGIPHPCKNEQNETWSCNSSSITKRYKLLKTPFTTITNKPSLSSRVQLQQQFSALLRATR